MSETSKTESLISRLKRPKPLLPKKNCTPAEEDKWRHDLYDWLDQVLGTFTATNIKETIINDGPDPFPNPPTSEGFGPVKVDFYSDYLWTNSSTAFGGTFVGTRYFPGCYLSELQGFGGDCQGVSAGPPRSVVNAIRMSFNVIPNFTENYKFRVDSDDGVRFYLNGSLAVDNWGGGGAFDLPDPPYTGNVIALTAGVPVPVVIEVVNSGGSSNHARLRWLSTNETGGNLYNIPTSALSRGA